MAIAIDIPYFTRRSFHLGVVHLAVVYRPVDVAVGGKLRTARGGSRGGSWLEAVGGGGGGVLRGVEGGGGGKVLGIVNPAIDRLHCRHRHGHGPGLRACAGGMGAGWQRGSGKGVRRGGVHVLHGLVVRGGHLAFHKLALHAGSCLGQTLAHMVADLRTGRREGWRIWWAVGWRVAMPCHAML